MPLTVFDIKGIPARRERIVAAVEAGGAHVTERYEAWITSDPFGGGVQFALDEESYEIIDQIRATLED